MCLVSIFLYSMLFSIADSVKTDSTDVAMCDSIWKNIRLENIIIEGSGITHFPDKDVWTITKEMRKNTFDTNSLICKIPGFYYDRFTDKLSFWGWDNILVTIDGRTKEEGYGGSLANIRFKKIEVYQHPSGRYAGYDVVVNLITYENWKGYDAKGNNRFTFLPSTIYGNTISKMLYDNTYTYTRPQIDISSCFRFSHDDKRYNQGLSILGNDTRYYSLPEDTYTSKIKQSEYYAYVDFDYKISKKHIVSAKVSFSDEEGNTESSYNIRKENLLTFQKTELERYSLNRSDIKDCTMSVFYQGKIKKWGINTELTHEKYIEKSRYLFKEAWEFESNNWLNNNRNTWLMSADALMNMGEKGTINLGYNIYYKEYMSNEELLNEGFSSRHIRNKCYLNMSRSLGNKCSVKFGVSAEAINMKNATNKYTQTIWGGFFSVRHGSMRDKFSINLNYKSSTKYPTLYQILPIKNLSDPILSYKGNTKIKVVQAHAFVLSARWNRLNLNTAFSYSIDDIIPVFSKEGAVVIRSYENGNNLMHSSVLSFYPRSNKIFGNDLRFRASLTYSGNYVGNPYFRYVDYWGGQVAVSYIIERIIGIQFDYTKMTMKSVNGQTIAQKANDSWQLQLSKDFFGQRIQCFLAYTLPINWGINSMTFTNVKTPYYKSNFSYDTFCYRKNEILLRVIVHLAKGHVVKKKYNEQSKEKEVYNDIY